MPQSGPVFFANFPTKFFTEKTILPNNDFGNRSTVLMLSSLFRTQVRRKIEPKKKVSAVEVRAKILNGIEKSGMGTWDMTLCIEFDLNDGMKYFDSLLNCCEMIILFKVILNISTHKKIPFE